MSLFLGYLADWKSGWTASAALPWRSGGRRRDNTAARTAAPTATATAPTAALFATVARALISGVLSRA
ncbi:MAG: hypothetical protein ACRDOD_05880 [Streptosporangiaceae bacterium]